LHTSSSHEAELLALLEDLDRELTTDSRKSLEEVVQGVRRPRQRVPGRVTGLLDPEPTASAFAETPVGVR
jgi:hypothetical protein